MREIVRALGTSNRHSVPHAYFRIFVCVVALQIPQVIECHHEQQAAVSGRRRACINSELDERALQSKAEGD